MMDVQKTIASEVEMCWVQFQDLIESGNLQQFDSTVKLSQWEDELGRFRVWISNIGAHQTCQLSLEYRLRDASHIKSQVMRQLGRLNRLLVDLRDIAEEGSDTEAPDDEMELDAAKEVQMVYSDLLHTLSHLYEMSIIIRKPSSHDRLRQIEKYDLSDFKVNDLQHVYAKYPHADRCILDRLGVANSKRRALLKYRESHHRNLGYGVDEEDNKAAAPSETVATEFKNSAVCSWGAQSESDQSTTSYGSLTIDGDQGSAHLTFPEATMADGPYECELCYHVVQTSDRQSWMRHIFSDLMPYVCTFPDCRTPDRLYERSHQWVEHLRSHNPPSFNLSSYACIECPLCQEKIAQGSVFYRHLGRHLENLSLFALPRSLFEEWMIEPTLNDVTQSELEVQKSSQISKLRFFQGIPGAKKTTLEEEPSSSSQDEDLAAAEIDESNLTSDVNQETERTIQDGDQADRQMNDYSADLSRIVQSMKTGFSFWSCCECGQMGSEALYPERCSCCNHVRCHTCGPA